MHSSGDREFCTRSASGVQPTRLARSTDPASITFWAASGRTSTSARCALPPATKTRNATPTGRATAAALARGRQRNPRPPTASSTSTNSVPSTAT